MPAKSKYVTYSKIEHLNKKSGFVQVNPSVMTLIYNLKITPAEKLLLGHIFIESTRSQYYFKQALLPKTNKSIRKLANELGLSPSYISELRNSLIDKGLISTEAESKAKGTTLILQLPLMSLNDIESKKFKQRSVNKKIEKKRKAEVLASRSTTSQDVLDLQNELLSKISELNSQQIALHRALSSDKKHAVSYQENKAKLRTLRYRLGQLNEKLSQLQKEGIRKRISIAEQEIHSATLAAEEGGTVEKKSASFITAKHTKNIIESLKALGVSPPDEYAKQILFSIRYGFYAEKGYTTRHAINNALQRIKDNRWFVTSDYDPRKVEGLFRFHLKKTNPNSHLKNKNA